MPPPLRRAELRRRIALAATLFAAVAHAETPPRPLPEAVLTESATDVDAESAGEVEWELNAGEFGAQQGGSRSVTGSIEVEWRVLRELGVRLEPSLEHTTDGATSCRRFGAAGALAVGLFHDFRRDEHLQFEVLGHTKDCDEQSFESSDAELPAAADLVGALRRGRWTLRGTAGAEAFGHFAHAPLHTDLALLTGFREREHYGFVALDLRADWARRAPLVVAPEVAADASTLGIPLRLGLALPFNIGAAPTSQSFGILLRLVLLSGREAER